MNRNQLLLLIGIVLVLATIAIISWLAISYFSLPKEGTPVPGDSAPSDPFGSITVPGSVATDSTLRVTARDGGVIEVPDFTAGKEAIEFNGESYYFLYGPEYSTEGFTFSLQYQAMDSSFLIELLAEPLGSARADATRYLGELLRLSEAELCEVRTTVTVRDSLSAQYARYSDLGLRGCEGSIPLP